MAVKKTNTCPICKGTGTIKRPKDAVKSRYEEQAAVVRGLQKEGYSIRDIQAFLGLRSTSTVAYYLKKPVKK